MKKKLFILLLFCNSICFSQDTVVSRQKSSGQHTIYGEFLGNALYWGTLGYDYTLTLHKNHKLAFNCGFQYMPSTSIIFSVAPQISYLFAIEKNKHFEIGIGVNCYSRFLELTDWMIPFRLGYRYQKENGGLFFKVACTPMYTTIEFIGEDMRSDGEPYRWRFLPLWFGVAVGYTFK